MYTKIVLTVIAVCLLLLVIPKASAQEIAVGQVWTGASPVWGHEVPGRVTAPDP